MRGRGSMNRNYGSKHVTANETKMQFSNKSSEYITFPVYKLSILYISTIFLTKYQLNFYIKICKKSNLRLNVGLTLF